MDQVTGKHLLCNMLLIKTRTLTYDKVNHSVRIYGEEHILTLNLLNLTSIIFLLLFIEHLFIYLFLFRYH